MKRFIQDLSLALRELIHKPQLSLTVIITLALTVGGVIAAFNLNYLLIAKPLPYPDGDQLRAFYLETKNRVNGKESLHNTPVGMMEIYREAQKKQSGRLELVFESMGVLANTSDQPAVRTAFISPDYLRLLAAPLAKGRHFTLDEGLDQKSPVAIISFHTWQEYFNGDPNILQKGAQIGDTRFNIVGVLDASFVSYRPMLNESPIAIWMPWGYIDVPIDSWGSGFNSNLIAIGKTQQNPQTFTDQLTDHLQPIFFEQTTNIKGFKDSDINVRSQSLKEHIIGDSKKVSGILMAGAIILLLIACTNIVNTFLSRAVERSKTLAIQAAVGARPKHLFQTLFAESFLLTSAATLLGLITANWLFILLQELTAKQLPRLQELSLDIQTILFSIGLSSLLALLFAKLSSRAVDYRALRSQLQSSGKGSGLQVSTLSRRWLVVSQVSLTSLLMVVTAFVVRHSVSIMNQPVGFNADNVVTLLLDSRQQYDSNEQRLALLQVFKRALNDHPSVLDTGIALHPPIRAGEWSNAVFNREGESLGQVPFTGIGEHYFSVIEQPLLFGRTFTEQDMNENPSTSVILSASAAERLFGTVDATGKSIYRPNGTERRVIGVVADLFNPATPHASAAEKLYEPIVPWKTRFLIRLNSGQTLNKASIQAFIDEHAPGVRIEEFLPLDTIYQGLIYRHKLVAGFVFALCGLALVLTGIGIFGVLHYTSHMRRYELGVRMALGAQTHKIIRLILRDNLPPIGLGIITGFALGTIGFQWASQRFEMQASPNLVALFVAFALMFVVALVACYLPARRVIQEQPIKALRQV